MQGCRSLILAALTFVGAVSLPTAAVAQEVTAVVGAIIGDSLGDVVQTRTSSIREDFDNAPVYGARLGWSAYPFAVEGHLVTSSGDVGLTGGGALDARLVYAEADLQFILLPGPLSPFVAAGIGLHHLRLQGDGQGTETVRGYVLGGGLRAGLGSLALRVDLRDHVTPLEPAELDADFRDVLGIAEGKTLHNVELSAGVTVRF